MNESNNSNPVMLIVGIRKAVGDFKDDSGKDIQYNNTVVYALTEFSDKEKENGSTGLKPTEFKIAGSHHFNDYQHVKLPRQAALTFQWDFSSKVPKAKLMSLDFETYGVDHE